MTIQVLAETVSVSLPTGRPSLRKDLDAALAHLEHQHELIVKYTANPALDSHGGPLPLPMRRRIALNTAKKRVAVATAAYEARYKR